MDKIRFATIGTSRITRRFLKAAMPVEGFEWKAAYSRELQKAEKFAADMRTELTAEAGGNSIGLTADNICAENMLFFDSLESLAQCPEIDAVYVASPNCFHCGQVVMMLDAGKHVLCEKPISSNEAETKKMAAAAERSGKILMEAMRSVFDPGFARICELLPELGRIRSVFFHYCQYSSRYDAFKDKQKLNTFNPDLSNGALMDMGVYCVHAMLKMFGYPERVHASGLFLPAVTGRPDCAEDEGKNSCCNTASDMGREKRIDITGTVTSEYDAGFQVQLVYSKVSEGYIPSQIQGEDGTLVLDRLENTREIRLYRKGCREAQIIRIEKMPDNITYEIEEFLRLIRQDDRRSAESYLECSLMESRLLDEARRQMGIVFPADRK